MCGPHRPVGQTGDRRQSWSPTAQARCSSTRLASCRVIVFHDGLGPSAGETNGKGDRPGFYSGSGKRIEKKREKNLGN